MKSNIGLNDAQRKGVTKLLATLLADEYVLYTKSRNAHWNVTGPRFHDLHKFFEGQYGELDGVIDEVAERIRSMGDFTPATLGEFIRLSRLKEHAATFPNAAELITGLLADHETVIRALRVDLETAGKKFNDQGSCDFLTGLMEQHEKMAWMLRAMEGK